MSWFLLSRMIVLFCICWSWIFGISGGDVQVVAEGLTGMEAAELRWHDAILVDIL